jgi:hypothetical protein
MTAGNPTTVKKYVPRIRREDRGKKSPACAGDSLGLTAMGATEYSGLP